MACMIQSAHTLSFQKLLYHFPERNARKPVFNPFFHWMPSPFPRRFQLKFIPEKISLKRCKEIEKNRLRGISSKAKL